MKYHLWIDPSLTDEIFKPTLLVSSFQTSSLKSFTLHAIFISQTTVEIVIVEALSDSIDSLIAFTENLSVRELPFRTIFVGLLAYTSPWWSLEGILTSCG